MKTKTFFCVAVLTFASTAAADGLDTRKIDADLTSLGKNVGAVAKDVAAETEKALKKVDQSVRKSSFFDDVSGAASRAVESLKSGLRKTFGSSK